MPMQRPRDHVPGGLWADVDHNSLELEALARGEAPDRDDCEPVHRVVLDIPVEGIEGDTLSRLVERAERLSPWSLRIVEPDWLRLWVYRPAHCAPCAAAAAITRAHQHGLRVEQVRAGLPGTAAPAVEYGRCSKEPM